MIKVRNVLVVVLCLAGLLKGSFAGTGTFHRQTELDQLKSIDSLASTGLPLFTNGFFISTGKQKSFIWG
jgi:hypothetical protein